MMLLLFEVLKPKIFVKNVNIKMLPLIYRRGGGAQEEKGKFSNTLIYCKRGGFLKL